jgi:hypothetical protein
VGRPESLELSVEELRHVQLEVLAEFDHLCRRHGLTYYLAYGTLLGAIRHGGYIPWDDDIDVMMPRRDYDRLHDVFAHAPPAHVTLDSPKTRTDWPFPYAKVADDRTELFEPLEDPLPLAVNLDVFPLDALPSNRLSRGLQSRALRLLRWAVELRYIAAARGRGWHHPLAIAVGKPILRLVPVRTLVGAFTRTAVVGSGSGDRLGVRVGSFDWSVPACSSWHRRSPTRCSPRCTATTYSSRRNRSGSPIMGSRQFGARTTRSAFGTASRKRGGSQPGGVHRREGVLRLAQSAALEE